MEAPPQLFAQVEGELSVVVVFAVGWRQCLLNVPMQHSRRCLVAGEEAKRFHVHHEVVRRALGPQLRGGGRRHRVVARIDFDDAELRRVEPKPGLCRLAVLGVEAPAGDQRLVGPRSGANQHGHGFLLSQVRCSLLLDAYTVQACLKLFAPTPSPRSTISSAAPWSMAWTAT